jgi:hypothetical protein
MTSGHQTYRHAPSGVITPDEMPSSPTTPPGETLSSLTKPGESRGTPPSNTTADERHSGEMIREEILSSSSTTMESLSGNKTPGEFPFGSNITPDESPSINTTPDENPSTNTGPDETPFSKLAQNGAPSTNETPGETPSGGITPDEPHSSISASVETPSNVTTSDKEPSIQQRMRISSIINVPLNNTTPDEKPSSNAISEESPSGNSEPNGVPSYNATPGETLLNSSASGNPPSLGSAVEKPANSPAHSNNRSADEPPSYAHATPTDSDSPCDCLQCQKIKQTQVYDPPCNCVECEKQWIPRVSQETLWECHYTRVFTDREADQLARDLVQGIKDYKTHIETQWSRHGEIIVERWRSKTFKQRANLLTAVDPEMYPHHPGIPHFFWEYRNSDLVGAIKNFPNLPLIPYCNVEALGEDPAKFLVLLFNRAWIAPEYWVLQDSSFLNALWEIGIFEFFFNENAVIMHGDQYGQLTKQDPGSVHAWETIGFPRAILVLKAQTKLMSLLRAIVDKLIEGLPASCTNSSGWSWNPGRLGPGFKRSYEYELPSRYLYRPFFDPELFDVKKLLSLVHVSHDVAADHLWLLQTDPSYMSYYTKRIGEAHGILETGDAEGFVDYSKMALTLINDLGTYWCWGWIVQEVEKLLTLLDIPNSQIPRGEPLPPAIDYAFGTLDALTTHALNSYSRHLQAQKCIRPAFSYTWTIGDRVPPVYPGQKTQIRSDGIQSEEMFENDPLDWVLNEIKWEVDYPKAFDHATLFEFLERFLASRSTTREQKTRLDEILYRKYSEYGTLLELRLMVRSIRPRSTIRDVEDLKKNESGRGWKYISKDLESFTGDWWLKGSRVQRLADLLADFDKLPQPPGNRDEAWLNRDKDLRVALGTIWKTIREQYKKIHRKVDFCPDDIEAVLKDLSAADCPEHMARLEANRAQILAEIMARKAAKPSKGKKSGKKLAKNVSDSTETEAVPSSRARLPSPNQKENIKYHAEQTPADAYIDDSRYSNQENKAWERVAKKSKGNKSSKGKVLSKKLNAAAENQGGSPSETELPSSLNKEFLAALPDDIRAEVIEQERRNRNERVESQTKQTIAESHFENLRPSGLKLKSSELSTKKSKGKENLGLEAAKSLSGSGEAQDGPYSEMGGPRKQEEGVESQTQQAILKTDIKHSSPSEPVRATYAQVAKVGFPGKDDLKSDRTNRSADPTSGAEQSASLAIENQATEGVPKEERASTETVETADDWVVRVFVERFDFDILRAMFLNDGKDPKAVTWTSFLQAMENIGFVATHHCGSAVSFEPRNRSEWPFNEWHSKGSILFHRPHPGPKIHPVMLRAMGGRMRKRYGWTLELFMPWEYLESGVVQPATCTHGFHRRPVCSSNCLGDGGVSNR